MWVDHLRHIKKAKCCDALSGEKCSYSVHYISYWTTLSPAETVYNNNNPVGVNTNSSYYTRFAEFSKLHTVFQNFVSMENTHRDAAAECRALLLVLLV